MVEGLQRPLVEGIIEVGGVIVFLQILLFISFNPFMKH